jgi:hypothetical protein
MPDTKGVSTTTVQRRVRTGCLTCRKRRRKCDEAKPTCRNCEEKNLLCRYGLNITFVNSRSDELTLTPKQQTQDTAGRSLEAPLPHASEPWSLSGDPAVGSWSALAAVQTPSLPQAALTEAFGRFESLPTSPALQGYVTGNTPVTNSHQVSNQSDASPELQPSEGESLELVLLTSYRYEIAPRLDLGVGEPYFGVRALNRSQSDLALYHSILSLASCQRRPPGSNYPQHIDLDAGDHAAKAAAAASMADREDRLTISILLTLREFYKTPPRLWAERMEATFGNTSIALNEPNDAQWQLMARLAVAAQLMASPTSQAVDLSFVFQAANPMLSSQGLTHKQQLRQAISNLARALLIPKTDADARQTVSRLPLISTWQSCWAENQLWYSARREEMQQILEVEEFDSRLSTDVTVSPFPTILFSNVCALVANVAHHLTALLLLHIKPRAIKALAEIGSSTSPVWHAQRLIGIVATFVEPDIFDPLVIAGLLYAARKLSHPSQIQAVVDILKKAKGVTGMELQEEIEKLETARINSSS